MNYHTPQSLHLPHGGVSDTIRIRFADDETYVEIEFIESNRLVGQLRWECGVSTERIDRRFARRYVEVCRQIPLYCTGDMATLYAAVCEICQRER